MEHFNSKGGCGIHWHCTLIKAFKEDLASAIDKRLQIITVISFYFEWIIFMIEILVLNNFRMNWVERNLFYSNKYLGMWNRRHLKSVSIYNPHGAC